MPVQHIGNLSEFKTLLESEGLVVVDFSAEWCGPCKFIAPKFEKMSDETPNVVFAKVDVDEAEDVASSEGIKAMPTFKFFKGGKKVAEVMGADIAKITALIQEHQ